MRIFGRLTEAGRERHLRAEGLLHLFRRTLQQRGVEDARQDRVDADGFARQVAGDRQGHADNTGLGGGIGSLADLAVLSRNGRRVDDRAAVTVRQRVQRHHAGSGLGDAAERADQVDLDDQVELVGRERLDLTGFLVAAGGLDGVADAGAIHQDALLADGLARRGESCVDAGFVGHVALGEHAAEFLGKGFTLFGIQVEDADLDAFSGQGTRRGFAETGRTARDDGGNGTIKLHGSKPPDCMLRLIVRTAIGRGCTMKKTSCDRGLGPSGPAPKSARF